MTVIGKVWGVRLWLGALLLFGASILVWFNAITQTPLDWLLQALTCVLLAVLVLDLAVRYRVRDIYDTMALIAIYALLAGLLLFPATAYDDFPRTLLTRVLGAQGLVGLEMLGLLLAMCCLNNPRMRRLLLPAVAWNGFYWGVWLRWLPVFNREVPPFSLSQALTLAAVVFAVVWLIGLVGRHAARSVQPLDFRLSLVGFLLLVAALVIVLILQALQGHLSAGPLLASALLIIVAWAILWFRRTDTEPMLFEAFFPAQPPALLWWGAIVGVFMLAFLFAYALPLVGNERINQLWLMEVGYGAVGALWFPIPAIVLAFRGIDRQMRTSTL